jgi:uncharacterized protein
MTESAVAPRSGVTRWTVRHPVVAFLALAIPSAYALTGIAALAEYDVIPGRGVPRQLGIDMEEAASLLMIAAIFASALTVTYVCDGRRGVRVLLSRVTRWRVGLRWWLIAVVALPAGTVAVAALLGDKASVPDAPDLLVEIGSLLFALAVINVWEEGTWTGFLQTRLERRFNFFVSAAIATVPFALVHLPLRVITREATNAGELLGALGSLLVVCFVVRTLFAAVARGALNSVLMAAVTHTMFNRSNNTDGLAADILSGSNRQSAALLTTGLLTILVLIGTRGRLTKAHRDELDSAEAEKLVGAR